MYGMVKIKKKLSASVKKARREAKLERQEKYETVFMSGKQVRVKRPQIIEGIPVDEFISQNADSIWLHQNEMWELIDDSTF
jgi:hypothetical protein